MRTWIKNNIEWYKSFFSSVTAQSMMRLLNHACVFSGNGIIWFCAITQTEGYAAYGLELAILGVVGKGYQEYNIRKKETKTTVQDGKDT